MPLLGLLRDVLHVICLLREPALLPGSQLTLQFISEPSSFLISGRTKPSRAHSARRLCGVAVAWGSPDAVSSFT